MVCVSIAGLAGRISRRGVGAGQIIRTPAAVGNPGEQARRSVKRAQAAADAGDVHGMLKLARAYAEGDGISQNDELAVAWVRKAVEVGSHEIVYANGKLPVGPWWPSIPPRN